MVRRDPLELEGHSESGRPARGGDGRTELEEEDKQFRLRRQRRFCRFPVSLVTVSLPCLPRRRPDAHSLSRFPLPLPPQLENRVT